MKNNKTVAAILLFFLALSFQSCLKDDTLNNPKAMAITGIDVLQYPMSKSSGSGWDLTTGPDIFVSITQGTSVSSSDDVTGYHLNATGGALSYTLSNPYTINSLSSSWSIGIFDADDFDPDDYMGGIVFTPEDYKSGLPSSFSLSVGDVQFRLHVTWNF